MSDKQTIKEALVDAIWYLESSSDVEDLEKALTALDNLIEKAALVEVVKGMKKPTELSSFGKLPDYSGQLENLTTNKAIDEMLKALEEL